MRRTGRCNLVTGYIYRDGAKSRDITGMTLPLS